MAAAMQRMARLQALETPWAVGAGAWGDTGRDVDSDAGRRRARLQAQETPWRCLSIVQAFERTQCEAAVALLSTVPLGGGVTATLAPADEALFAARRALEVPWRMLAQAQAMAGPTPGAREHSVPVASPSASLVAQGFAQRGAVAATWRPYKPTPTTPAQLAQMARWRDGETVWAGWPVPGSGSGSASAADC